jgi:predicted DNA-binding antitoxin AbrB/MazE fold protein
MRRMATKKAVEIDAVYENGVIRPLNDPHLQDGEKVRVRIESLVQKPRRKHSPLELRGLGRELWQGVDVDEYIDQERESWGTHNAS